MNLRERLIAVIAERGPMSVAEYMAACLHDPEGGYYATRPRLGEKGDFITAPNVSQMFGELLGLWAAEIWNRLGRPPRVSLVELGPGDGTMMADVLRAAKAAPAFLAACRVWLAETSVPLAALQAAAPKDAPARWIETIEALPADVPLILLANEFLDCLPIDQAAWTGEGWLERRVGVDGAGELAFVMGSTSTHARPPDAPSIMRPRGAARHLPREEAQGRIENATARPSILHREAGETFRGASYSRRDGGGVRPPGSILEFSTALTAFGQAIGGLIARAGGAALFIDYGRDTPGCGDTLQAVRNHHKESPLAHPGEADLTAHVDFPAFLEAARAAGALTPRARSQGDFLRALGIETRAAALAGARPDSAGLIARQLARLIAPGQMGDLFKAACVHAPGLVPPGFEV
ncbi:MAG: SAM-dependent methyltransferase [Caulobacteraceae bacterium]